jgi:two-component system sensor histidine kinase NblS
MNKIWQWWLSINWKTRSISLLILVVSVLMSTLAFVLLIYLQNELTEISVRFFRDFSSLLAYTIAPLIYSNSKADLISLIEQIYLNNSTIDYLNLFNAEGGQLLAFPMDSSFFKYFNDLSFDVLDSRNLILLSNLPLLNLSIDLAHGVTHCFIPLVTENIVVGFLQLGLSFNSSTLYLTKLFQSVSLLTFISVWLIFILGIAFNFFIIMSPMKDLLRGIRSILSGNFDYRIETFVRGELGDVIISFNTMCEKLQFYEKKNILQLNVEKAKLESLLATVADGAILLDSELRIILVNRIAIKIFHWVNKDLIGHFIFHHLPVHVNNALLPILNTMVRSTCFDNKNISFQELKINLNFESLKTVRFLLSTTPNYNRQSFNGIVIIIQDLTKENLLNEAKNQFISNVSHELRTPLCNIGSFLETLIDYNHKLSVQQKKQFLGIAYAETQRLNSLVNDVLDLSRLESECSYILKPLSLNNSICYIVQASQIIASNKQVKIIMEFYDHSQNVFAHKSSLSQVLSNLISNALKFTHKKGRIIIRAYPILIQKHNLRFFEFSSDFVRVEVIDEGIGIQTIFHRQIFDRFMRIENNIHVLKGTGLGLSIVKNIIQKHNSSINVYSEVNVGTSFWFDLCLVG